MKVLGVIVNFRTADLTLRAIETLLADTESLPGFHTIVVDNDSGDGSFEMLTNAVATRGYENRVTVLASGHNGGLGYGINVALRAGLSMDDGFEAVYLLNSDAFPDPGCLPGLVEFLAERPRVGIVGSRVHGVQGDDHTTTFRFPTLIGEFNANLKLGFFTRLVRGHVQAIEMPEEAARVGWVAGCSMLIRRAVIDAIGMFDEGFFLYYEETDFCLRAANAGFETWFLPSSAVTHIGSVSTGFQDNSKPRARYWFESRNRYFRKHHGSAYLAAANAGWVLSFLLWRVRRALQGLPDPDPPRLLGDFLRFSCLPDTRASGPSAALSGGSR